MPFKAIYNVTLDGNVISTSSVVIGDVLIQPGQTVNIVGTVNQTSEVPEPATLLLLGAGLAGGISVGKRRKTSG